MLILMSFERNRKWRTITALDDYYPVSLLHMQATWIVIHLLKEAGTFKSCKMYE